MSSPGAGVASPCVSLCTLDEQDVCVGCHRSVDEIIRWRQMDDTERSEVLIRAEKRGRSYKPFGSTDGSRGIC